MSEGEDAADKPRMPARMKELGDKAIERHLRRPGTPPLEITLENGRWWFGSPFAAEDEDHWVALMFDAFGTRSQATFRTFMCQLAGLCSNDWNEADKAWHPSEDELVAAIQIVRSTRPRNEAEACLAAQMVAVHLMQMNLSAQALKHSWADARTCSIAGKLARTYAMQLETMSKLKGRSSRQRITVRKYAQHEHKHIHLHQGDSENGNQPHGPRGRRGAEIQANLEHAGGTALPCADAARDSLPMSRGTVPEQVPTAWRSTRVGSSER
jgi:hypothetical protein